MSLSEAVGVVVVILAAIELIRTKGADVVAWAVVLLGVLLVLPLIGIHVSAVLAIVPNDVQPGPWPR